MNSFREHQKTASLRTLGRVVRAVAASGREAPKFPLAELALFRPSLTGESETQLTDREEVLHNTLS